MSLPVLFAACGSSGSGGSVGTDGGGIVTASGGSATVVDSGGGTPVIGTGGATGGNPPTSGSLLTGGTTTTATGTQDGGGCEELAVVAVCVDGSDWLHIQGATGWFTHGSYDAAGAHPDCVALGMSGVGTVNGTNTPLAWPNGDGAGQPSSTFALPLAVPTVDGTLLLTPVQARGGLSVTTNPSSTDGYDGVIFIDDSAISGAAVYEFKISLCIGTGGGTGAGGAGGGGGGSSDAGGPTGDFCGTGSLSCGAGSCASNTTCTTDLKCHCPTGFQMQACDGTPCNGDFTTKCAWPGYQCVLYDGPRFDSFTSCDSSPGSPGTYWRKWEGTNNGGSGTVTITTSVSGNQNMGIAGEPDVSKQVDLIAGHTYALIMRLPLVMVKGPLACPVTPCTGNAFGPQVSITGFSLSFTVAPYGIGSIASANGEPTMTLQDVTDVPWPVRDAGGFVGICYGAKCGSSLECGDGGITW